MTEPQNNAGYVSRLLDILGTTAQLFADEKPIKYAWGQHVRDDTGDNRGQRGIHGTAQAVMGLARGIQFLGKSGRHQQYLEGGLNWLQWYLSDPRKPIDLRKTVKIAELTAALANSVAEQSSLDTSLATLLSGRNALNGGWSFDLSDPTHPGIVPTLFALDALIRCRARFSKYEPEIIEAIQYCLNNLPDTGEKDKRAACIYKFISTIALDDHIASQCDKALSAAEAALVDAESDEIELLHRTTFNYRIKRADGIEETAFCTIQTGLLKVWYSLWNRGRAIFQSSEDQSGVLSKLIELLHAPPEVPFPLVESCAVALRICADFPNFSATVIAVAESVSATTPKPIDPLADVVERERLYLTMLTAVKVRQVRILQSLLGGWSDAYLDLCEVTDASGAVMSLQVFKLMSFADAKQEEQGARLAEGFIDRTNRVALLDSTMDEANRRGLLRYAFASPLTDGSVIPFLEFFANAGNVTEVGDTIEQHYNESLAQLFKNKTVHQSSLMEFRQYFEDMRGGVFWSSVTQGLEKLKTEGLVQGYAERQSRLFLRIPFEIVINLFAETPENSAAWKTHFPSFQCPNGHRDHNPRNLLMVQQKRRGPYAPVLIDFHRFGGPLPIPLDFARFEAGIQVKGLKEEIAKSRRDEQMARSLAEYERLVNSKADFEADLGETSVVRSGGSLAKLAQLKARVRKCFMQATGPAREYERAYFGILMLCYVSYLRPFYYDRLTPEQRAYALYAGSRIFERHFVTR